MMTVLLPALMSYALIGEAVHEWLGIAITVLFVVHHGLNFARFKSYFKGRYTPVRLFGAIVNAALLLVMLLLPLSGIMMSRHVFPTLRFGSAAGARTIHLLASYWGFILMSVHIGLHWNEIGARLKKADPRLRKALTAAGLITAGYGASAFHRREIASYLFLGNQFVFFDFDEPRIRFFADYLAIMICFAGIGFLIAAGLKRIERTRSVRT